MQESLFSFDYIKILLFLFCGILAGIINTLAGNGTVITLPLLVFFGLEPQTANGTNRIGVIMQGFVSFFSLKSNQPYSLKKYWFLIIPCLFTASLGAYTATVINPKIFTKILVFVMLLMLYLVLQKPEKWLKEHQHVVWTRREKVYLSIAFLFMGFYGGFIQAGMGIFMLTTLVLLGNISIREANSVKSFIIVLINIPAILVFIWQGQIFWLYGLLIGLGQSLGAWLTARYIMQHKDAGLWVRRVLVLVIIVAIVKFALD